MVILSDKVSPDLNQVSSMIWAANEVPLHHLDATKTDLQQSNTNEEQHVVSELFVFNCLSYWQDFSTKMEPKRSPPTPACEIASFLNLYTFRAKKVVTSAFMQFQNRCVSMNCTKCFRIKVFHFISKSV